MKLTSNEREELIRLINKLLNEENESEQSEILNLEEIIIDHMHELGIPTHIVGYKYLCMAVKESINDPERLDKISKNLYPDIAKAYKVTVTTVERAMGVAIEVSCCTYNYQTSEIFGNTISSKKKKPKSSEFIATLVEHIRVKHLR